MVKQTKKKKTKQNKKNPHKQTTTTTKQNTRDKNKRPSPLPRTTTSKQISNSENQNETKSNKQNTHVHTTICVSMVVFVCLLVGCLMSQQQASVSQGRICSDNFTCCHTEIEVADPTFYLTQSQYTDTGPTSPSADPITPGAWQGSPLECQFLSHWYDSTPKKSSRKLDSNPGPSALEADALTTRPTRRSYGGGGVDNSNNNDTDNAI